MVEGDNKIADNKIADQANLTWTDFYKFLDDESSNYHFKHNIQKFKTTPLFSNQSTKFTTMNLYRHKQTNVAIKPTKRVP